jgi:DNA-binding transcriptional LysR family regulator
MSDIDASQIRRLDFTLLLVLQALLRHRRTTDAARQLGLSQSAISHALTRLRALFGDELFLRRPHGMEPTRHALALAPRIDGLLADAAAALGLASHFEPATTTRVFRLGAPDFLATLIGAPLTRAMEREAPGARLALRIAVGQEALRTLERDEIDLAVGRFAAPGEAFRIQPLYADRYCAIARAGHPALNRGMTRRVFETLRHVTVSIAGDFRAPTDEDLRELGLQRRVGATAPRFTIAFDIVGKTDMIGIAPSRLAQAYAGMFGLALHDLPFRMPPIEVAAVSRPRDDPGVAWLARQLSEVLQARAWGPDARSGALAPAHSGHRLRL